MSAAPSEVQAWAMALEFLAEAERVPSAAVPRMATHAAYYAYYAMFHGARAVLLRLEGLSAPAKHNVVVSRFGYHAKQANDAILMAAARALNTVQQERLRCDYDAGSLPQPQDAAAAVAEARAFLAVCAQTHGFAAP